MFDRVVNKAQDAAARTARKAALGLGALLCLTAGAAFLTFAAWLFLLTVTTPLIAATIIGGAFFGFGLLLLGIAAANGSNDTSSHAPTSTTEAHGTDEMGPKIVDAFMTGLQAGRRART